MSDSTTLNIFIYITLTLGVCTLVLALVVKWLVSRVIALRLQVEANNKSIDLLLRASEELLSEARP